ncbi:MAG TPA: aldehyde dehydrogenase [Candidatus Caccenecus avistercoris]|nr:aldehyde dehydrogenase [Candidatus Caccenecus avistercoris]
MKSLIGNKWCDSSDGKVIEVYNPATNELVDTVPSLTKEDVERAIDYADAHQKDWEAKSVIERCEVLSRFAELVEENKDELAMLLSKETGKPIKEAYNEIANIGIGVPGYVEKVKHEYGNIVYRGTEKGQENTIQYTIQQPLGVVVAIIPFNFPSDIFINKVPPALLMGNAVILKPASVNPLTLTRYVELLVEAGVPAGVISVVHGSGSVVGKTLTSSKKVDMVSLTGSTAAGIDAAKNCADHCAHSSLELGGNDAFILCADGDMDLAIEETVWGRLYNTGQVCCASKRFLVENSVKDEFIRKMTDKINSLKQGNPQDMSTDIGCLVSEEAAIEVERQVNETIAAGATLVCGGKRNGAFYEPTILDNVTPDMEVAKDMEIFGPVIPVIGFDDLEEAIEIANKSIYGLSGSIITKDISKAIKVSEKMECGGFVINGASFFRSFEQPFGGWKYSGIGNEGIMTTLKEMSRTKTVILKNITK